MASHSGTGAVAAITTTTTATTAIASGGRDLPWTGFFSNSTSVGVGDPFGVKQAPKPRDVGRQLQTSPAKKGQTGDNWANKNYHMNRLFEGEVYHDPGELERKERYLESKKNLKQNGFVPSSPPKKSVGLGTNYGRIGGKIEYTEQGPNQKPKITHETRQIQTSPHKKGSYGYIGITIGKEPRYSSEPYEIAHEAEKREKEQHTKKQGTAAFKTTSHSVDVFDAYPHVGTSKIYTIDRELPPVRTKPKKLVSLSYPFVPSHTPLQGYNCTFMPFPEYKESLYNNEALKEIEAVHEGKKKIVGPNWKPTSTPKSTLQSHLESILLLLEVDIPIRSMVLPFQAARHQPHF